MSNIKNLEWAKRTALEILSGSRYESPPIDPAEVARKHNIRVLDCTFKDDNVSGYYDFDEKAIYVNRNEFVKRQQFTIAHELGHAILHSEWVNTAEYTCLYRDQLVKPSRDIKEQEANEFAGNLLVPSFMLARYYDELRNSPSYLHEDIIQRISEIFYVSIPVIKIRLKNEYGYTAKKA